MRNFLLYSIILFSLLPACNKDEEIIIDNTIEDPEISLGYKVLEYTPAPGQYINELANGSAGIYTPEEACAYAEARFKNSQYVSLGAWGGYIIVKFNESIINSSDYDFQIASNSFDTSNEPGIVWVMKDTNGNGIPDDVWYELKGSYFQKPGYERDFAVTYKRPEPRENTPWESITGETGEINWMGNYHSQEFYYPQWIKDDTYTLYGSLLPSQASKDEITGFWKNDAFEWGYADNFGADFLSNGLKNQFRISDAVSADNQPIELSSIDFVKVQSAVLDNSGWLGEISTEVSGFFPCTNY